MRLIQLRENDHAKQHRAEVRTCGGFLPVMKVEYPEHFEEFADAFDSTKWPEFVRCLKMFCEIYEETFMPKRIGRDPNYTSSYQKISFFLDKDQDNRYESHLSLKMYATIGANCF